MHSREAPAGHELGLMPPPPSPNCDPSTNLSEGDTPPSASHSVSRPTALPPLPLLPQLWACLLVATLPPVLPLTL